MRNRSTRRVSLANWLCLGIITLLLAGCFQPAGNDLEPTSVDLVALTLIATQQRELSPTLFVTAIPSEGFTPPTLTPIPTEVRVFPTPEPPTLPPTETPTAEIPLPVEPTTIPPAEVTGLPVVAATSTPSETPTLSIVLPPTPTALPGDTPCLHTVQVGEWLYSIARKYNIDPVDLIAANPGWENRTLQPGDVIRIPHCNQPTAPPPTAVPPTQSAGGTSGEIPTPIPLIDRVYIVASGDTLGAIARKFGVTVQMLKDANGLTSDFLRVGQQLKIPKPQE
jgi:LysM repeat protein